MESQHPIKAEGDMHLARETIIAADVGCDIEKRFLVESAVGILRPAVLITVQDVQAFHRTAADRATDIRPGFVQSPTAILQYATTTDTHITAVFEYIMAIGHVAWHRAYEAFKTCAQMFS